MTHPLTKASCAACRGWQGPWARAAGTGDQTRVTFEHTLLSQMTPLRSWAPEVDRRDPPSHSIPGSLPWGRRNCRYLILA